MKAKSAGSTGVLAAHADERDHPPSTTPPLSESPSQRNQHIDRVITLLSVMFFVSGLTVAIAHPLLGMLQGWAIQTTSFCFSMTGTLILYYFLTSSAHIENTWVKIGGAAAGFLCLFLVLTDRLQVMLPKTTTPAIPSVPAGLEKDVTSIFTDYGAIDRLNNATIKNIARNSLHSVRRTFGQLATGTYTIEASDLPIYLLPLVDNAKTRYWATQFVLPETFWDQYWTKPYFEKNIEAVKERNVDLLRIFILDAIETNKQKLILDDLINKHIDAGLRVLILDRAEYETKYGSEDLIDMLLVDNELTGILLLQKGGKFSQVEFSIDPQVIKDREQRFMRLMSFAIDYQTWVAKYHRDWIR